MRVSDRQTSEIDWYRLAQDRNKWHNLAMAAYPKEQVSREREGELDAWRTGVPIPAWAQPHLEQGERNYEDSGNELGERRCGGDDRRVDPRQYGQRAGQPTTREG